jgi:antitoxin VapB
MVDFLLYGVIFSSGEHALALNIKNPEVERLANEVANLTGETKTEAVRKALAERRARLSQRIAEPERTDRLRRFLHTEVWSRVPDDQLGRMPDREEREEILGYGPAGV